MFSTGNDAFGVKLKHVLCIVIPMHTSIAGGNHLCYRELKRLANVVHCIKGMVLKAGDRLEEIDGMRDVVKCDVRSLEPGTALHFYRPSKHNRLIHWCPLLFDRSYADEPCLKGSQLVHDVLHTADGGCAQYSAGVTFQLVFDNAPDALRVPVGPKVVKPYKNSMMAFKSPKGAHGIRESPEASTQTNFTYPGNPQIIYLN